MKRLAATMVALVVLMALAASGSSPPTGGESEGRQHPRSADEQLLAAQTMLAVGEAILRGGNGYWTAYADGAVVANAPAPVLGDMTGKWLNEPVTGIAATPDDRGYWLVAADGGVFTFGNAPFYGSTGSQHLNQPVVGMAPTPDGHGYWLVAADGGVFTFGNAPFYGSTGSQHLNQPVVGMAPTPDGHGYWLVAADGGVFTFGNAPFHGSMANSYPLSGTHATGIASPGTGGYWIENDHGGVTSMDAPMVGATPPRSSPMPVNQDPPQSLPAPSDYYWNCFGSSYNASACDRSALNAINVALAGEGYRPLPLPPDYFVLPIAAQLVAVANAERSVRGLPAMPENGSLDYLAYQGAASGVDPTGPAGHVWGSNLAMGYSTVLAADYAFMYDDGINSPNIDCVYPGAAGCWAHRHNILIQGSGEAGAAFSDNQGTRNLTELFVVNY